MTPEELKIQKTKIKLMKIGISLMVLAILLFGFYAVSWVVYIKVWH